jgi:hypothetical protein
MYNTRYTDRACTTRISQLCSLWHSQVSQACQPWHSKTRSLPGYNTPLPRPLQEKDYRHLRPRQYHVRGQVQSLSGHQYPVRTLAHSLPALPLLDLTRLPPAPPPPPALLISPLDPPLPPLRLHSENASTTVHLYRVALVILHPHTFAWEPDGGCELDVIRHTSNKT